MTNIIRNTFALGLAISVVTLITWLSFGAFEKEMCNRLSNQSKQNYNGFYITALDRDECNAIGVSIDAPIK